jgi:hypothetical protein
MFKGEEGRRCQGGGEAPPRYQTPREEERAPNVVGPFGPETVAAVPGRRLVPPQYQTTQGRRRGSPEKLGRFAPV